MSVVTEHLEQRGIAFELIPHQEVYTSGEEARALVVIPASCRLHLRLVRGALDDRHARLASEEEPGRRWPAAPPRRPATRCRAATPHPPGTIRSRTLVASAGRRTCRIHQRCWSRT